MPRVVVSCVFESTFVRVGVIWHVRMERRKPEVAINK